MNGNSFRGERSASRNGLEKLLEVIVDDQDARVPPEARSFLLALRNQLALPKQQILGADRRIVAWYRASEMSRRLDDISGVGPLIRPQWTQA